MTLRTRERERRLEALETVAAERAKAEDKLDWSLFDSEQLEAVLDLVESGDAGTLTEDEMEARLEAVPGMEEAAERAFAERDARRARR